MSNYYYDYTMMNREEKLSFLHGMFHDPGTSPENMEIIHKEFQKVLHSDKMTSQESLGSTFYP